MTFNQELFDRVASVYDESPSFFATLGRALVERAGIPDGAGVIDLGVGRGAVTIALRASMARGPITAVDISPGMLAAVDALQLEEVTTLHADLVALLDTVDVIPVAVPVGDAEGYWSWTQSHGARWVSDVLAPEDTERLRREVVASLEQLHPTRGAHIMVAPQITRMIRS